MAFPVSRSTATVRHSLPPSAHVAAAPVHSAAKYRALAVDLGSLDQTVKLSTAGAPLGVSLNSQAYAVHKWLYGVLCRVVIDLANTQPLHNAPADSNC